MVTAPLPSPCRGDTHRVPPGCAHHQQAHPSSDRSGRATGLAARGRRVAVGWRPIRQALSVDYEVIAFDLPGFGRSPALPPEVTPTAAALADAIEGELDRRLAWPGSTSPGIPWVPGPLLEPATRGRTHSVIAIAPDGLGTPLERLHQAAALLTGRTLAMLLAPIAPQVAATGAGRSLFFAMERSRPWQLPADDAGQLLLDFAQAPGTWRPCRRPCSMSRRG